MSSAHELFQEGFALKKQGLLSEAVEKFNKSLEIDPDEANTHKILGITLYQLGLKDEAIQALYSALELDPGDRQVADYVNAIPKGEGIPFTKVRVENTNACKYTCDMCPREKMSRKTGIMSPEDYQGFLDRFEEYIEETGLPQPFATTFFMHGYGEPLLDPGLAEKSAMVRKRFPASSPLIFTTLGVRRSESYLKNLLDAGGLRNIVVSFYGFQQTTYDAIQNGGDFKTARANLIRLAEFNKSLGNPCIIQVQVLLPNTWDTIARDPAEKAAFDELMSILEPLGVTVVELSLHNFGDGRSYFPADTDKTVCSVVHGLRRMHLNVSWDLKILPCCFDYNGEVVLGDLRKQSIAEIYRGEKYEKFLAAHRAGNLDDYPVCKGCDQR